MAFAMADLDDIKQHYPLREDIRYTAHCELPDDTPLSEMTELPAIFSVEARINEREKRKKTK